MSVRNRPLYPTSKLHHWLTLTRECWELSASALTPVTIRSWPLSNVCAESATISNVKAPSLADADARVLGIERFCIDAGDNSQHAAQQCLCGIGHYIQRRSSITG